MASVVERATSSASGVHQLTDPHYNAGAGEVKSDATQMKSTSDTICDMLLDRSLAYWITSETEKAWPHPENRLEMWLGPSRRARAARLHH